MTSLVIGNTDALTMSSREIAELVGKKHKDVIRDIRVMLDALGDGADLRHVQEIKDPRGYTAEFRLPKDLTLTLVTGYDVKRRHAINVRWLELESKAAQPQFQIPQTMAEALRLAADLSDQNTRLAGENAKLAEVVEEAQPKVEFFEAVAQNDSLITVAEAAKVLGTGEKRLFALLRDRGYLRKNSVAAKQSFIDRGLFQLKVTDYLLPSGQRRANLQTMITGKGLIYLQRRYFHATGGEQLKLRINPNPPGTVREGTAGFKILSLLSSNQSRLFSETEICEAVGVSRGAVSCSLNKLRFYGRVESVPAPYNSSHLRWKINSAASMA